jgi:AhpD family alkylhydroperoxidase
MAATSLQDIDPALDHLSAFSQRTNGLTAKVQALREEAIYTEGHFPAKTKVLAAALWSVSARCEPCLKFYIKKAKEYGATTEEIAEFLGIAPAMGACVGEMWAVKGFHAAINGTDATPVEEWCT